MSTFPSRSRIASVTPSQSTSRSALGALGVLVALIATLAFQVAPAAAAPDSISLDPASTTKGVGGDHTLTATVTDGGSAAAGVQVLFFLDSGANCGYQYTCGGSVDSFGSTDSAGQATFQLHGYVVGTDTVRAVIDANGNYVADSGELNDSATTQWIVPSADSVVLTPESDTSNTGTTRSVTAKVTNGGVNVGGMRVFFQVSGVNNCPYWYGNCLGGDTDQVTDANGEATFTYSSAYSGQDTITMYADTDGTGTPSVGDLTDTATKTWVSRNAASIALNADQLGKIATGSTRCVYTNALDSSSNPYGNRPVGFRVTGSNSDSQNANSDISGNNTFCYAGTAGSDTITVFADNDSDGNQDPGEPFDSVQQTWVQGPVSISLLPESETNSVGSPHTVTATVTDGNNNPVEGMAVFFQAYGAVYCGYNLYYCGDAGYKLTNASGEATYTYSSNTSGQDTINAWADANDNAYVDGPDPNDTATKDWTTDDATAVMMGADQLNKIAEDSTRCVSANSTTASGGAYGNRPAGFTVTGTNSDSQIANTNSSGGSSFCYTPASPGTDTLTIFADNDSDGNQDPGEPFDSVQQVVVQGPVSISLLPESETNSVGSPHTVTATVTDGNNNPVEGMAVFFQAYGAVYCGYNLYYCGDAGYKLTNASGEATYTYSSNTSGQDTINAWADANDNAYVDGPDPNDTATKDWTTDDATAVMMGADQLNKIAEDSTRCVSANSTTASGGAYGNRPAGFTVTGTNSDSQIANTNSSGGSSFCYTPASPGTDTLTIFADNDSDGNQDPGEPFDSVQQVVVQGPVSISLLPESETNSVGSPHTVTATVTDGNNNPVEGMAVFFQAYGAVYCGYNLYYCGDAGYKLTNASGEATYTYSSNTSGQDTINAWADANDNAYVDGPDPNDTAIKNWQQTPASLTLSPKTSRTTVTGIQHCLTATVEDANSNPVPNATVRFPVTGANGHTGTETTDASGHAQHCYTGDNVGPDSIEAYADIDTDGNHDAGEPGDTGATKRWITQPDTLTLEPASANYPVDTTQTLTATVTNGGSPVAGVEVIFNVTSNIYGPRPAIHEVTNASGVATTSYSSSVEETDTIIAFADTNLSDGQDAGEASGTGTATWSDAAPASLVLSPQSDTNTIGTEHCVNGTVTEAGGLTQANRRVVFSVSGANTDGGTRISNPQGVARFCYTGTSTGGDTITAFVDYIPSPSGNGTQDPGEPGDTATKLWINPQHLDVTKTGAGNGSVTSDPSGIDCGSTCSGDFAQGATVTLDAVANGTSSFDGWSGSGCSGTGQCQVTMDAAKSVTANFSDVPLVADAGDDQVVGYGDEVTFDGTASRPEAGISSYSWDFGDSSSGTGAVAHHTYCGSGQLHRDADGHARRLDRHRPDGRDGQPRRGSPPGVNVTVQDSSGNGSRKRERARPRQQGEEVPGEDQWRAARRRSGAFPTAPTPCTPSPTATCRRRDRSPQTNGSGSVTLQLRSGELGTSDLHVHRMTYDEIIAAGIDPNDPNNQNVIEFTIHLCFSDTGSCTDLGGFMNNGASGGGFIGAGGGGGGGGLGGSCDSDRCVFHSPDGTELIGTPEFVNDQPHIFWMIIPGKARFLKEFFDVGMAVTNLTDASDPFTFENGNATLQLPDGLSLAPTANEQSLSVAMPDIPGQTTKSHALDHPRRQGRPLHDPDRLHRHARAVRRPGHLHRPQRDADQGLGHERPSDHRGRGRPGVPHVSVQGADRAQERDRQRSGERNRRLQPERRAAHGGHAELHLFAEAAARVRHRRRSSRARRGSRRTTCSCHRTPASST